MTEDEITEMHTKQRTLDFPIRKTRTSKTKDKVAVDSSDVICGRSSRSQNKKNVAFDRSQRFSNRERSSSKSENARLENHLERTPTKRKILQEYDQENCCSPPKAVQTHIPRKDQGSEERSHNCAPHLNYIGENLPNGANFGTLRVVLSPVKLCSLENSKNQNEILTRSKSPFKSPNKVLNVKFSSSLENVKELQSIQNPSKSVLRRLDLDSPIKSPLRVSLPSPLKSTAGEKLELNSSTKSPLKRLDFGSPRRSPRKHNVNDSILISPRKFNLEENSPRRSPRKLPMSPLKFGSPSSLVSTLSLSSPNNKRNIAVALFKPNVSAYRAVRQSLNTGTPTTLVCREEQIKSMQDFLISHLEEGNPGSLYISGAPGTGKTACLHSILDNMVKKDIKRVFINCMTLKTSSAIYGKIVSELGLTARGSEKENLRLIERRLVNSKHPIIIVLDEIDQLDSKNQEVLYSIFEWPSREDSKLVLVGIANALDLTDRILPRLQARPTIKPKLLHFPPYSKAEIVQIINQRIQQAGLGDTQVIRPTAIQFLAGKVASVAGDVRKALDVCRRAVELCEIQAKRQSVLKPTSGSPRKSPRKGENALKMVDIPQVLAIFNEVYGSRVISAVTNAPESFSLQQKLLICCFLLLLKHAKSKDITVGKFHDVYTKVCKKRNIPGMDQSEFLSLCMLLESRGMLQVKKSKEVRSSKIMLRLNPEEAEQVLGDRTLLASVLGDKESLGKLCKT